MYYNIIIESFSKLTNRTLSNDEDFSRFLRKFYILSLDKDYLRDFPNCNVDFKVASKDVMKELISNYLEKVAQEDVLRQRLSNKEELKKLLKVANKELVLEVLEELRED